MKFIQLHEVVTQTSTVNAHVSEIFLNKDMIKALKRLPNHGTTPQLGPRTKVDLVGGNVPFLVVESIEDIQKLSEDIVKVDLMPFSPQPDDEELLVYERE